MKKKEDEVKIAVCQIFCLDGDRGGNFVRIENALKEVKKLGADIACFPETTIYGWVNPGAHQLADAIPGRDSKQLCALAKKYELFIAIGLAEKQGDTLYDAAILIDDTGRILLKHRKFNILSQLMKPPYTPGDGKVSFVDTHFGKIGMMICADSFVKEYIKHMAKIHPDIILIPYGWVAEKDAWPEHGKELQKIVTKVAGSTKATVVGTDLVGQISHGPWKGQVYGGQSIAVDATGQILTLAKDRDRDIKVFTVHIGISAPTISPESSKFLHRNPLEITLKAPEGEIRYTKDNTEPTEASLLYKKPLLIEKTTTIKARTFLENKKSAVVSGYYEEITGLQPAVSLQHPKPGLKYRYYEGKWKKLPDFNTLKAIKSGICSNFTLDIAEQENHFGLVFHGFIHITEDGLYTFYLKSDDGSKLFIDNRVLIDNDGCHGAWEIEEQIALEKGFHTIQVQYFDDKLYHSLTVNYQANGSIKLLIPDNLLFYE